MWLLLWTIVLKTLFMILIRQSNEKKKVFYLSSSQVKMLLHNKHHNLLCVYILNIPLLTVSMASFNRVFYRWCYCCWCFHTLLLMMIVIIVMIQLYGVILNNFITINTSGKILKQVDLILIFNKHTIYWRNSQTNWQLAHLNNLHVNFKLTYLLAYLLF